MTEAPHGAAGLRRQLAAGWSQSLVGASLAFAPVLGLALVVALLRAAGSATAFDAVRQGALVPAVVHRVPITAGPVTMRVAFLLATAAVGWLLFRGGRAVAARVGGPAMLRALHGAKVAGPYAAASLALSLLARGAPASGLGGLGTPGESLSPSVPGSVLWPLALAMVCGAVGGVSARPPGGAVELRTRSILAGGWRSAWLSAGLGTAGLLVVLALHPAAVRGFVDAAYGRGPASGTLALASTANLLPNAGTGVAAAAMGGAIEIEAFGVSCTAVSYWRLPGGGATSGPCGRLPFGLRSTPPVYLLFLVVPAVAAASGGWLAARRGRAASPSQGAGLGAASGAAFAGLFGALCLAARLTYELTGTLAALVGRFEVAVGPEPVVGFALALAWGMGGGSAGGWLAARSQTAAGPGLPGPPEPSDGSD